MDKKVETVKPECDALMRMVPPENHLDFDRHFQGVCKPCNWVGGIHDSFQGARGEMDRHLKKPKKIAPGE